MTAYLLTGLGIVAFWSGVAARVLFTTIQKIKHARTDYDRRNHQAETDALEETDTCLLAITQTITVTAPTLAQWTSERTIEETLEPGEYRVVAADATHVFVIPATQWNWLWADTFAISRDDLPATTTS